ncbi:MAG TPA: MFS transporter, partial [Thermomicrobiales bacterium]|nr:MFS transporter [Thermomicrobiales bacterium]
MPACGLSLRRRCSLPLSNRTITARTAINPGDLGDNAGANEGWGGEGQTVVEYGARTGIGGGLVGTAFRIRSGYFWFYAAVGAFTPYISLYYRDLGMTGFQLGILMALPALWTALTGPVWGAVADSLAIHRLLLRSVFLVAAAVALVSTRPTHFVTLLILMSILAASLVPVTPLMDSYAVSEAERRGVSYGSLRVLGSIGYTVMVLVMGGVLGDRVSSRFLIW